MARNQSRRTLRLGRHASIRRNIAGTAERPRLAVFKSSRHIYAQVIDDAAGVTIAAACTLDTEIRSVPKAKKIDQASAVGKLLARRAIEKLISTVVLDRGGHKYHGRLAALANAAREAGLKF